MLQKVEAGGYASDLLLRETSALETRDAGLASEIVFGVLRRRAQLDYLIERHSGPRKLDSAVRTALRMGTYQLRHLDRVPPHAAISESVELVKRARKVSAAGFVNAVLRRVETGDVEWPSRAIALSCPEWLLSRWNRQYGVETAEGAARAALQPPEKYMRGGRMQDIGAQAVVPLLGLRAAQTFLDLCAAPGNKTAQAMETGVRTFACDVHFHRLATMKGMGAELAVVDGTRPLPFGRRFERVLVDVPCSGTGTLGRNPEIKWKLREKDLANLQQRQAALLRNALAVLAPGGILVYSTCSLEREENEDVVAAAGARVCETMQRIPGRDPGDGFFAAVITSGL